jgi:methionyl-tRNA formyltransferase
LKVEVLCSDPRNHIWPKLALWAAERGFSLLERKEQLQGGELLLLVSCTEVIPPEIRGLYESCLVIHESALPKGRGWSPFAWQVLEGRSEIVVSLLDAADPIDSGAILAQRVVRLYGHELSDELNSTRDAVRIELCEWAVENHRTAERMEQVGEPTFYARRRPADSRIDPERSIAEQFDLLRICEARFPAFFELRGHRYEIELRKSQVS